MKIKKISALLALLEAVLLSASFSGPILAAGYAKDPGYKEIETEKQAGENANSIAVDAGITASEDSEEEITELSADYEGTNDGGMIVAAPDALSPGAFRKLAQRGLDYAVEIKAPESEDVIARYVVKADEAAKMRKTVRLTSKALSDEVLTEVQRQLGDAYIASAFYSTQLFGNVLVNAFVNVQIKANDALEAMLAQGKKPVVYKVNENTGKLTKYAIDAAYEDGFICFDIQKGDSYVVSAEDAIGEYEVITEAPEIEEEETEEVTEAAEEETAAEEVTTEEAAAETSASDTGDDDPGESEEDSGPSEAEIVARLSAEGGTENEALKQRVLDYLRSETTNHKAEMSFGYSYYLNERVLKDLLIEGIGLDPAEYDVEFTTIWGGWPDYETRDDAESFIERYQGNGAGISTGGWFEFVLYDRETKNYTCFTGGGPGAVSDDLLLTGEHVDMAIRKDLDADVERVMKLDLTASGWWNGKKNAMEDIVLVLPISLAAADEETLCAEIVETIRGGMVNDWENYNDFFAPIEDVEGEPEIRVEYLEEGYAEVVIEGPQEYRFTFGFELIFE